MESNPGQTPVGISPLPRKDLSYPSARIFDWNEIHPCIIDPNRSSLRLRDDYYITANVMMGEALRIYIMPEILEDVRKSIREAKAEMPPPRAPDNFALEKIAFYAAIWTEITRKLDAVIGVEDDTDGEWCFVSVKG